MRSNQVGVRELDLLPIEESACYRRLRDPRIVDSEPFTPPNRECCFGAKAAHESSPKEAGETRSRLRQIAEAIGEGVRRPGPALARLRPRRSKAVREAEAPAGC